MSYTKTKVKRDAEKVLECFQDANAIYTFGNGGSCSIANHMEVDWTKNSKGLIEMRSLCANTAMIMMIANDYGYEETCAQQIRWLPLLEAVLVLVSSSGNSANIVRAAKTAIEKGYFVVGFTGFDGGKLKKLSHVSVHIDSKDYEEAENYHHEVMHQVSRLLRGIK